MNGSQCQERGGRHRAYTPWAICRAPGAAQCLPKWPWVTSGPGLAVKIHCKIEGNPKIKSQHSEKGPVDAIRTFSGREEKLLRARLEFCTFAGLLLILGEVKAYARTVRKHCDALVRDSVVAEARLSHSGDHQKEGASCFTANPTWSNQADQVKKHQA